MKLQKLMFWIMPAISNLCCGMMYALALGVEFSIHSLMLIVMGLLFAVIGNYMPKTKMNYTIGIKVVWAYTSEENWAATHRFAGKVWVGGGALIMATSFFGSFVFFMVVTFAMALTPIAYSYLYYRNHEKENNDGN